MSSSLKRVRSSLWFVPVMCVLAGALLSVVTIGIDRWADFEAVPRWLTGGPKAATTSAILVETIAVVDGVARRLGAGSTTDTVVVQLAMGQFSPRIVQTFLQDRPSELAIVNSSPTICHVDVDAARSALRRGWPGARDPGSSSPTSSRR